jgi:uncharacterized protein (TIGR02466 family)
MNTMQKNKGQIYPLFSKVVYENIIDDLNFKKIVKDINDDFIDAGYRTKLDVSNISMASQNKNVLENKKFKKIKDRILKEFEYFNDHFLKYENKFKITTSWFTKTEKGKESNYHNHSNCMISGVLYLQTDDKSGSINFIDYSNRRFKLISKEYHVYNCMDFTFVPKNGLILFFPSEMHHKILRNESDITRYSIAFNLVPYGDIWIKGDDSYLNLK